MSTTNTPPGPLGPVREQPGPAAAPGNAADAPSAAPANRRPEPEPLTRENLRIGASLALGSFMVLLDSTVVSVATPALAARFGASLSAVAWATTAYLLTLSLVIPLSAWAMERFGGKRVWLGAVAVFCLGSLLCGTAWSISSLIVMRVVQGLGGGLIPPVGQALIGRTVGPRQMARVMAVLSVPMLLGPVLGPVVAGLLIDDAGWRWIFLINLPLGLLAVFLVRRAVPAQPAQPGHRLDLRGVLMVSPGLAALVYGCAEVGAAGGLGSAGGDAALVGGVVLLIAFGWYGLRPQAATTATATARGLLLDLRLLTSRGTGAAMAGAFLLGAGMYGALFLLPLYFQQAEGADALHAGLLLGPQGVGAAATSLLAGRLQSRTGGRVLVATGMAVCSLGTVPFVLLTAATSTSWLAAVLLVRGFGMGLVMAPLFTAAYAGLERAAIPRASTLFNILNRLGGSLGTAAVAVALQRRLSAASPATGTAAHFASAYNAAFAWALVISVVAMGAAFLLPGRPPRGSL
ncbi:MAG TPA: MDR family MFS transporter [Actinocrinis sp.]|jgi:EmrB/QacA subfamily drug resistance transporter